MNRLAGKVALISGGARGQGATEAQLFVAEGASVVFGDVLDDDGKKVEAEIRAAGGQATYVHLDVTREADWRAAVATAVQAYGKLNVLVNNAGILFRAKIEETSEADWDRIMAVNVKGVFLGTKCALPAMRQAGGGSIINISSTAGLVGSPGGTAAYTATKGAVRLFTKSTAIQHARDKHPLQLRASRADRDRHDQGHARGPRAWEQRLRRLPMGRVGHAGGSRVRRPLPRVRRIVVRDGQRAGDRRRHHRRVDRRIERRELPMALTLAEANQIVQGALAKAKEMNIKISVAVCDAGGRLVAFNRMDGALWAGAYGSQGKAIASAAFARPSGELAERAGSPIIQGIAAAEGGHMIPSQGAVPIIRNGMVDGACGVGGGTAQQDEDCARAGVAKLG